MDKVECVILFVNIAGRSETPLVYVDGDILIDDNSVILTYTFNGDRDVFRGRGSNGHFFLTNGSNDVMELHRMPGTHHLNGYYRNNDGERGMVRVEL